jgi:phage gp46-like protein
MILPVEKNDDFDSFKTLNEDVQVKPISDTSNHWDIQMSKGDYVNVTGKESLKNAICIAIMTRFNELDYLELYDGFGCRAHQLVKKNKSEMTRYKVELFITEVLENMRRIQSVNSVKVSDDNEQSYFIEFDVTSTSDEIVSGSVII